MYQEASNANLIMLLNTAVFPLISALIIGLLASRWLRNATFLGYLGGFVFGLALIHPGLSFPPNKAIDFLTVSAALGAVAVVTSHRLIHSSQQASVNLVIAALSFYLLLNPVLKHSGIVVSLTWALACSLVSILYFAVSKLPKEPSNLALQSLLPCIGLMIIAAGVAPVVSIGGSLLIGQLFGAFAASLFGYCLVAFIMKQTTSHYFPAWLVFSGLLAQSHVLADIPWSITLLFLAASFVMPLTLKALGNPPNFSKAIKAIIVQAIVTGVLTGISLYLVWPQSSLY
ncbi:hypothetical protein [Marinomonas epiphytica]